MKFNLELCSFTISNIITNNSGLKCETKVDGNNCHIEILTSKKIKVGSLNLHLEGKTLMMGHRDGVCLYGEFSDEIMSRVNAEIHKLNDLNSGDSSES